MVQNPSVELEPNEGQHISATDSVEMLEREKFLEEEAIVSQDITSHLSLPISEEHSLHLESLRDMDQIYMTQKEIDEKLLSNSFQVSFRPFTLNPIKIWGHSMAGGQPNVQDCPR